MQANDGRRESEMLKLATVLLVMLIAITAPAQAKPPASLRHAPVLVPSTSASQAQSYEQCRENAGGVIPALKDCDAAELGRREAILNKLYQQVLRAVGPGQQARLRKAERAWVAFAEAECDFRMAPEVGGMDAPLVCNVCRLEVIARRIEDLRRTLEIAQFLARGSGM